MVDQLSTSAVLMTRHNPSSHQSVLLVSHTSFYQPSERWEYIHPLAIEGIIEEILFESIVQHPHDKQSIRDFNRSKDVINGLDQTNVYFKENLVIEESRCVRLTSPNSPDYTGYRIVELTDEFRPGSIVVLQVSLLPQIRQSLNHLRELVKQFSNPSSEFNKIVNQLTLVDLQRIVYRPSVEEQADGKGSDVYQIPDYGTLHYSGLQGQMSVLEKIRLFNDLRHPIVNNLKQGNWLMDYISTRLKHFPSTKQVRDCLVDFHLISL